jgi:hypothetical protein
MVAQNTFQNNSISLAFPLKTGCKGLILCASTPPPTGA